jgi:hypothetical protein
MVAGRDLWVKIMGQSRANGVHNLMRSRRLGVPLQSYRQGLEAANISA